MSKNTFSAAFVGILLLLVTISCSSTSASSTPKLPNYGVFLVDGDSFIELEQHTGQPSRAAISSNLITASADPVFLVWYPQMDQQYFLLVSLDRPGAGIQYKVTLKDDKNQILEISPASLLSDDIYCFYQGDPLGNPYNLPFWCFQVGNAVTNDASILPEATDVPSTTTLPQATDVPSTTTLPQATDVPSTTTPQEDLIKQWAIKTGDIQYIGIAADGTVYGIGNQLYAIISKDGEVLQTNDIDLTDCLRSNFSGGSGDMEIDRWFTIRPDGTILTTTFINPCVIYPGNPPKVERIDNGDYFPYADDLNPRKTPSPPDGFMNNFGGYLYFSRLNAYDFFVNVNEKLAAFVNHNGELQHFALPDDLDLEKHLHELQIRVTPWDDIYYSYPSFDALGNNLGTKRMKVESDGTLKPLDSFPHIGDIPNLNTVDNLSFFHPIYLPERSEIYFYQGDALKIYDLDFNYLREYSLPPDFPEITYGLVSSTKKLFVGHDGAVYVFDIGGSDAKTLTKYSLPLASTQTNQTAQPSEDWEFIKSKILPIISNISTYQYRGNGQNRHGIYTVEGKDAPSQLYSLKTYENGLILEEVSSGNTYCYRENDAEWSCSPSQPMDFSVWSTNIVTAASALPGFTLDNYGSKLETLDGKQYYLFFVEQHYQETDYQSIIRSELYFDITTFYPVYFVDTTTILVNDVVSEQSSSKTEFYDFNVPVEIIMPQQ